MVCSQGFPLSLCRKSGSGINRCSSEREGEKEGRRRGEKGGGMGKGEEREARWERGKGERERKAERQKTERQSNQRDEG